MTPFDATMTARTAPGRTGTPIDDLPDQVLERRRIACLRRRGDYPGGMEELNARGETPDEERARLQKLQDDDLEQARRFMAEGARLQEATFDRALLALAPAGMGLSVSAVTFLVGRGETVSLPLSIATWTLFGLATCMVLATFPISVFRLRRDIRKIEDIEAGRLEYTDDAVRPCRLARLSILLQRGAGALLGLALISLVGLLGQAVAVGNQGGGGDKPSIGTGGGQPDKTREDGAPMPRPRVVPKPSAPAPKPKGDGK